MSEPFTLSRPTMRDRHIRPTFQTGASTKQGVLFTGGDCCPGQEDLPFDFTPAEPDALMSCMHRPLPLPVSAPLPEPAVADAVVLATFTVGQRVRFVGNRHWPARTDTIWQIFAGRTGTLFHVFTTQGTDGGVFTASELEPAE